MSDDIGRDDHVELSGHVRVNLALPVDERHRAVQGAGRDAVAIEERRHSQHALLREADDGGMLRYVLVMHEALELDGRRSLALDDLDVLGITEHPRDVVGGLRGADGVEVFERSADEKVRPVMTSVVVDDPVRLVEDDGVALHRSHLRRAADYRCARVDLLLARQVSDRILAMTLDELVVVLLREHAQRPRIDELAARVLLVVLRQQLHRSVRLARVRRSSEHDRMLDRVGAASDVHRHVLVDASALSLDLLVVGTLLGDGPLVLLERLRIPVAALQPQQVDAAILGLVEHRRFATALRVPLDLVVVDETLCERRGQVE